MQVLEYFAELDRPVADLDPTELRKALDDLKRRLSIRFRRGEATFLVAAEHWPSSPLLSSLQAEFDTPVLCVVGRTRELNGLLQPERLDAIAPDRERDSYDEYQLAFEDLSAR